MHQANKNSYDFMRYCAKERWVSFWHQINEVIRLHPETVLEVGPGPGIFRDYIKNHTSIKYTSLDIDDDSRSDYKGSIVKMSFGDGNFDLVCAFQVLEHLPFGQFEDVLKELSRVTKKYVFLSLPHFGHSLKIYFKIPSIKEKQFAVRLPWPIRHVSGGEHYWEIGKKGFSSRKIKGIIKRYFILKNDFIPFENQYHHFYMLEKK